MQVAGYFKGVMGTGEHGRQLAEALRSQGVQLALATLRPEGSPEDDELLPVSDERAHRGDFAHFNLLCANAEMVPPVAAQLGDEFFADRYTIGFWAWEVSLFPTRFLPSFGYLDEVWVGSRHVRDAVASIATVPVVVIPQPVSLAPISLHAKQLGGIGDGFRFLFAFDHLSVFERKNPVAAIEAFTRAFAPGAGATLVIKSLNHEYNPDAHARLRVAAGMHPDVHLIEDRLSRDERDALMGAADCYVSLHRAEGFGYTLAESMWLGKPVIATGYSGNTDFMTEKNSYLVDYRLVPIGPGSDPYPPEGVWAEPDIDHAAALMRDVFEHQEDARRRGERAAQDIRANHGPEAAGTAMVRRLELLSASEHSYPGRLAAPIATRRVGELIRSGPIPPGQPRFGAAQRVARRGLLRLLKPLMVHQRRVDSELLDALEALDTRVEALASVQGEMRRHLEELEAAARQSAKSDR